MMGEALLPISAVLLKETSGLRHAYTERTLEAVRTTPRRVQGQRWETHPTQPQIKQMRQTKEDQKPKDRATAKNN